METTRESKIERIYEVMSDKTISKGLKFSFEGGTYEVLHFKHKDNVSLDTIRYHGEGERERFMDMGYHYFTSWCKILGHPVMINRIEFVLDEIEYKQVRKSINKDELLLPIDDWNEYAIDILYSIIKDYGIQQ